MRPQQDVRAETVPAPAPSVVHIRESHEIQVIYRVACSQLQPSSNWFVDKVVPPALSGTIVAVVAGFLIAQKMERFKGNRDHLSKAVDALRAQLAALQKAAGAYWSSERKEETDAILEAEIEFLLRDIAVLVAICAPELFRGQSDRGPDIVADLLAAATGEMFGSTGRMKDLSRISKVSLLASNLNKQIANARGTYFKTRGLRSAWPFKRKAKNSSN